MNGKTAEVIGDLAGVSRSSAQKFFNGKPISVENFRSLCKVLELNWEEIAESEGVEPSVSSRKRVAFVIEGSVDDLDPTKLAKLQAIVRALQQLTGDASMTTVDIEEGSIRLILEGSVEGIEKLKQLFDERELTEVLGTSVRAIETIQYDTFNETRGEDCLKLLLISTIRSQGALGADLGGVNLSRTNLSAFDLRGANLTGADLSGANLTGADLSGANLTGADLSEANLTGADLSGADLRPSTARNLARDLAHYLALTRDRYLSFARTSYNTLACNLALDLARDLDLAYSRYLVLTYTSDLSSVHTLARDLAYEINRIHDLAHELARTSDLAHNLDLARYLSNACYFAYHLASDNADFGDTNFGDTNFSDTNFNGAAVENARFGRGMGLTESEKLDLRQRGAIFYESTGDRALVFR